MGRAREPQIFTVEQRPDLAQVLADDPNHPINRAWPAYIMNREYQLGYWTKAAQLPELNRFEFAVVERDVEGTEAIVAWAQSVPFFWPELAAAGGGPPSAAVLSTLPEGGWDTILARGVRQACARAGLPADDLAVPTAAMAQDLATSRRTEPPNALSALSITVRPDRRGAALAGRCMEAMKAAARAAGLRALVVPLRPTRKCEHAHVPMAEYVRWTQRRGGAAAEAPGRAEPADLPPFDPWLRKHVRAGGKVVQIAPASLTVRASVAEWQAWTGLDLEGVARHAADWKTEQGSGRSYAEVAIPGGLVPLRVFADLGECVYEEPNVWVYHAL